MSMARTTPAQKPRGLSRRTRFWLTGPPEWSAWPMLERASEARSVTSPVYQVVSLAACAICGRGNRAANGALGVVSGLFGFFGRLFGDNHVGDFGVGGGGDDVFGFELGLHRIGPAVDDLLRVGVADAGEGF